MKKFFEKRYILLFSVLVFALVIRLHNLVSVPEGFEQTEAAFAYDSYSILKSGHDEYGKFLPLVLTSIGDHKLGGYTYWQIPFIAIFGLNEFSARLSSVVAAMISLYLVYDIVILLFKNRKLALLTLFITAISPWHIIFSRMAFDPIVALMAIQLSVSLFIRWYKKGRVTYLVASLLSVSFGIFVYYAVWVILPLILVIYLIYMLKKPVRGKKLFVCILILLLPWIVVIKLLEVTQGQRLTQDSTFQVAVDPLIAEQIREDQYEFPSIITRSFHNKLIFYPQSILQQLSKNLSLDFLFLNGDKIDRRFFVPYTGVLLLWTAPFLLLGFMYFNKKHSILESLTILGSVMCVFVGSSFSEFGSEAERTLIAVPIFTFLISYGLIFFFKGIENKTLYLCLAIISSILFIFNIAFFNHQYYWHGNVHQPWGRSYGTAEMVTTVNILQNKYKKVVVPDNTYIFFYFYNKVDPKIALEDIKQTHSKKNLLGLRIRASIDDYLTMPVECPSFGKLNVLYICQGTKIPRNSKIIKVIRYRDTQPSYTLLEFTKTQNNENPPENMNFMEDSGLLEENSPIYWKE